MLSFELWKDFKLEFLSSNNDRKWDEWISSLRVCCAKWRCNNMLIFKMDTLATNISCNLTLICIPYNILYVNTDIHKYFVWIKSFSKFLTKTWSSNQIICVLLICRKNILQYISPCASKQLIGRIIVSNLKDQRLISIEINSISKVFVVTVIYYWS